MAPATPPFNEPASSEEVFHWMEAGRLSSDSAVRHLTRLDTRPTLRSKTGNHAAPSESDVEAVLAELDGLVGLTEIKRMVREIRAFVVIQDFRESAGLTTQPQMLHMIFTGAPGTGKTTVARILGRLFQALGTLNKGHLVEVERADLVGEYIGHTAQKTREVIKRALGGVMFVDEAYALARGGEKDFGKEAIDTLVAAMENYRDEFLLILAGYPAEMAGFLRTNPGLLSRFPIRLDFLDYRATELMAITRLMLRDRQYQLSADAEAGLLRFFADHEGRWHQNAGNARMVRNALERAMRRQAVRLMAKAPPLSRADLMTLVWLDFEGGL